MRSLEFYRDPWGDGTSKELRIERRRARKRIKEADRRDYLAEVDRVAQDEAREESDEWFDSQLPDEYRKSPQMTTEIT